MMSTSTRQLSAIMFTDIVGYTTLMGENEQKAMELVRVNRKLQQPLVEKHGGKWLKEMGDGTLCRFDSALNAVNCALYIQRSARADFDEKLRVGIHLGDITIEGGEIYGDGVNIASRVESIADPGGIYVTEAVHKAIRGSNVQSQFLGEMELKNVTYPVKVYTLQGPGLPAPEVQKKELKGRFWAELGRRNVLRAALVYVIAALLLLQLGRTLLPVLNISPSSITILAILIIAGFLIAIYLAWNYERSPEGFVRTTSMESWQNPLKSSQRKPLTGNIIIAGMALIIVVMYVYPRYLANPVEEAGAGAEIRIVDKSIAVIPFKDMSPKGDQKYLADGVMEAILNHLAKIKDLRVISRNTMEMYRESNKSTPTIASEVGVSYILEGSVQRYADNVRITVQLIEGNTDQHLWSDNYDRDLTDIFAIQTEIAKSVAQELRATITSREQTIIESVPTSDLTAYDYYLKGMDYISRSHAEEDFLLYATQMFERAVEIDPNFTLAWVGLASASRSIYWEHYDKSEEHLAQTKQYLDRAIALDPDLMEVQLETGSYYYQCKLNYPKALQILEKLKSEYPNNDQLHATIGWVYRRMGQFQKAFEYMDHAISLNPSGLGGWSNAGETLLILGRYTQAEDYFKTAIDLNPSLADSYIELARVYLTTGEVDKARALLLNNQSIDGYYMTRSYVELIDRNYEEAIGILESSPHKVMADQTFYTPKPLQLGLIYYVMSDRELANKHFQKARQVLEDKLRELPDDSRLYSSLGIVYAGLGMTEEAMAANNKALAIINISVDALRGFWRELDMARILLMIGEYDEAIAKL
ncbi:MAG: tetratricopeptide repeat protein, partial [Bacteroidetes bacterium]|nr:tetratricopeptide repeat protein [Bacteroidota bacterium]